jgi:hypothetical protein
MFPEMVTGRMGKRERHSALAQRALADLNPWLSAIGRPRDPSLPLIAAEDAAPVVESDDMRKLTAAPA